MLVATASFRPSFFNHSIFLLFQVLFPDFLILLRHSPFVRVYVVQFVISNQSGLRDLGKLGVRMFNRLRKILCLLLCQFLLVLGFGQILRFWPCRNRPFWNQWLVRETQKSFRISVPSAGIFLGLLCNQGLVHLIIFLGQSVHGLNSLLHQLQKLNFFTIVFVNLFLDLLKLLFFHLNNFGNFDLALTLDILSPQFCVFPCDQHLQPEVGLVLFIELYLFKFFVFAYFCD